MPGSQIDNKPCSPPSDRDDGGRSARRELAQVLMVLALVVLVNLLTASRSPTVWVDEARFTDPAANLVEGHGLTSTAWPFQTSQELWAGNAPLHTWLLVPWIKVFGLTPTSVRAVNFIYMAIAALLLWVAVRRMGLISSSRLRVGLVGLVLLEYAVAFSYRSGRYDSLGILLAAAVIAAATLQSQAARMVLVAAIGVLAPFTGMQVIPYAVVMAALMFLIFGTPTLRITIPLGVGMAMGAALLYAVLHAMGAWQGFVTSIRLQKASFELPAGIVPVLKAIINEPPHVFWDDRSLTPILVALAIGFAASWCMGLRTWRRVEIASMVLCFVVPICLGVPAIFPTYYIWMISVPALIGAMVVWDRLRAGPSKWRRAPEMAIAVMLTIAGLVGLPARLGVTALEWSSRDYAPVESLVSRYVRAGDLVFATWQAFYPLHHANARAFYPGYPLTPSDKASVTLMVISPRELPDACKIIGGSWRKIGALPAMEYGFGAKLYDLAVYTRDSK